MSKINPTGAVNDAHFCTETGYGASFILFMKFLCGFGYEYWYARINFNLFV